MWSCGTRRPPIDTSSEVYESRQNGKLFEANVQTLRDYRRRDKVTLVGAQMSKNAHRA